MQCKSKPVEGTTTRVDQRALLGRERKERGEFKLAEIARHTPHAQISETAPKQGLESAPEK